MNIFHVDTFTDRAFSGNPAGVCILSHPKVDSWMQSVATEINLSNTAFLIRQADGYFMRWFTPKTEIDISGYATLACAHILWQETLVPPDSHINFYTRSGSMRAYRHDDGIGIDLPLFPDEPVLQTEDLPHLPGIPIMYAGKNKFDAIIAVDSEEMVRNFKPDRNVPAASLTTGLIITSRSDHPEYDFIARSFLPAGDWNEDSITGTALCCLGPFWARRRGCDILLAHEASRRGKTVKIAVKPDRIHLYGHAVTIIAGNIVV